MSLSSVLKLLQSSFSSTSRAKTHEHTVTSPLQPLPLSPLPCLASPHPSTAPQIHQPPQFITVAFPLCMYVPRSGLSLCGTVPASSYLLSPLSRSTTHPAAYTGNNGLSPLYLTSPRFASPFLPVPFLFLLLTLLPIPPRFLGPIRLHKARIPWLGGIIPRRKNTGLGS